MTWTTCAAQREKLQMRSKLQACYSCDGVEAPRGGGGGAEPRARGSTAGGGGTEPPARGSTAGEGRSRGRTADLWLLSGLLRTGQSWLSFWTDFLSVCSKARPLGLPPERRRPSHVQALTPHSDAASLQAPPRSVQRARSWKTRLSCPSWGCCQAAGCGEPGSPFPDDTGSSSLQ